MNCALFAKMDQIFSLKKKQNIKKDTGKMAKNTGKVREFCQSVKVGTLMYDLPTIFSSDVDLVLTTVNAFIQDTVYIREVRLHLPSMSPFLSAAPLIFLRAATKVAKVICTCLSFCSQGGGGVCLSACWDTIPLEADPPGADTPPREADCGIRSMSGRYASYWNAFLLTVYVINTTGLH